MIHLVSGNLLEAQTEALVNTVNCVGVMWKGESVELEQENTLPEKCRSCRGTNAGSIHSGCPFCADARFEESILCDLNRSVQDLGAFQCGAYRPGLVLVGESERNQSTSPPKSKMPSGRDRFQDTVRTQREKFSLLLGRQSLERQPDEVFADLKYHLAWNVIHRRPAFVEGNEYAAFFQEIFREYDESGGTLVRLLSLCTDHIHVYLECDVDRSVEDVILDIKQLSEDALLARFPNLKDRFFPEGDVWDPAYFVGTVG